MNFFDKIFELCPDVASDYIQYLNNYLTDEKQYCIDNPDNKYSQITAHYIDILSDNLAKINVDTNQQQSGFHKRDMKYNDFVEAYRLTKYQYSKYSQLRKGFTDAVYSTAVLEIIRHYTDLNAALDCLDCGCGPSRLTYELSSIYKNSNFTLLDFSLINLYFAHQLISSGENLQVPTRDFTPDADCQILDIASKNNSNVQYRVFNMDNFKSDTFDKKFDVITAIHSVDLLTSPLKTATEMVNALKPNGILVIADLLGWKENRETSRRVFPNNETMLKQLQQIPNAEILHYESGGPYCEWMNDERFDVYTNHLFVIKKI